MDKNKLLREKLTLLDELNKDLVNDDLGSNFLDFIKEYDQAVELAKEVEDIDGTLAKKLDSYWVKE
jgi:hypothetical protein